MKHAISVLEARIRHLGSLLGLENHNQSDLLTEIGLTVQSLQELRQMVHEITAAKEALVAAEEQLTNISAIGTVGGTKAHKVMSAIMAKRNLVRVDLRDHEVAHGTAARDLLEEIIATLEEVPGIEAQLSQPNIINPVLEHGEFTGETPAGSTVENQKPSSGENIAGMIRVGQVVTGEKGVHHNPDALIRHGLEKHLASQSRHRTAR